MGMGLEQYQISTCDALVTHCYRRENFIVTREATIWGLEIRGNYVLGGPTQSRQGLHTNTFECVDAQRNRKINY